jgi:hypothetical protein
MTGQLLRLATVSAMTECMIVRIAKADITRVIHEEPAFAVPSGFEASGDPNHELQQASGGQTDQGRCLML